MDLISDLQSRGLIAQTTDIDSLKEHLESSRTLYCGFDPTADSLHIGSLVPLLTLRRFQRAGHRPIALVGGATGLIGDPSFKATERQLNTTDVVESWSQKLASQVAQFIDFDCGDNAAEVVNNYDWTHNLSTLEFLRDVGKHFSVNQMIQRESVKQRIERPDQGISYTEFSYMLLQGYDFAKLAELHNCTLQIGGSDQWGNIISGVDLARRMNQTQCHALTLPLITKADGTKFGKTETGTIWLDASKTSPYAFYQFWINTADADVYRFLGYYTDLSMAEIAQIEAEDQARQGKPEAQRILAEQVTQLVHGEAGLAAAQRITAALFNGDLSALSAEDFAQLALDGMPSSAVDGGEIGLLAALSQGELAESNRKAREFVKNGAVQINGTKANDDSATLTRADALYDRYIVLKRGKKLYHLLDLGA
ncbi:MAG: tyrosine--tRNA ligase [Gammaproteobacteria bacterium]|nr:tyrosine--tRNA ligase [Gammaproteobacteria bacterium]